MDNKFDHLVCLLFRRTIVYPFTIYIVYVHTSYMLNLYVHIYDVHVQRFYRYVVFTLDQYVDMDYSLVYFHHGLASDNKPPLSWLWGLYKVTLFTIFSMCSTR